MVKLLLRGRPKTILRNDVETGHVHNAVKVPDYFNRKAPWMRAVGLILLVAFSPAIFLCMLLVRLTSPGRAIYQQTRVGKDEKPFKLYKIRTMYVDCENVSGPVLCQPGDSRITPVGRVLRFLHLDELPQLINVARGEMCLIGPRPERPEIILRHKLKETIPGFADRTKVLPGVTGLAQINLPADLSAECVKPKVKLDLEYIETATVGLDLRILMCTAFRMVGVRHGRAVRLFGLARRTEVSLQTAPAHKAAAFASNGLVNQNIVLTHNGNGSPRLAVVAADKGACNSLDWQTVAASDETLPKRPR